MLALEGGSYVEQPVSWYLAPSYPQDYYPNAGELVEITDQNAGNYPAGLGRGWYYIAGQEPFPDDTVTVKEFVEQFTHNVYWADNGNAEKSVRRALTALTSCNTPSTALLRIRHSPRNGWRIWV